MKAIPFICSRTKNKDFISSYLVRPDFDWTKIRAIVSDVMYDLNTLDDLRYAVFSSENFCFMGVGCLSSYMVNKIGYEVDREYLKDKVGRSLACFIGFAVPVSSEDIKKVPDILSEDFLKICCDTYFKHLKKQWDSTAEVVSEVISADSDECVDLPEKEIIVGNDYGPLDLTDSKKGIKITSNQNMEYFYYFLDMMINKQKKDFNFINHVDFEDQWQRLQFKYAQVSNEFKNNLAVIEKREDEKITSSIIKSMKKLYNEFTINGNNLEQENNNNQQKIAKLKSYYLYCMQAKSFSETDYYIQQYETEISDINTSDIEAFKNKAIELINSGNNVSDDKCKAQLRPFNENLLKEIDDFENNKKIIENLFKQKNTMEDLKNTFKKLESVESLIQTGNAEWNKIYYEIIKINPLNDTVCQKKKDLEAIIMSNINSKPHENQEQIKNQQENQYPNIEEDQFVTNQRTVEKSDIDCNKKNRNDNSKPKKVIFFDCFIKLVKWFKKNISDDSMEKMYDELINNGFEKKDIENMLNRFLNYIKNK